MQEGTLKIAWWQWLCLIIATTLRTDWLVLKIRQGLARILPWVDASKVQAGKSAGTMGALVALFVMLCFDLSLWMVLAIAVGSFFVGLVVVPIAANWFLITIGECVKHDGETTGIDFNQINWDEFHGMFVSVIPLYVVLALGYEIPSAGVIIFQIIAFAAFRYFDAWKDWMVRYVESSLPSGLGVMADDTAAGLEAAFVETLLIAVYFAF
jgi:phosphatidylglycerophosphatase A